MNAISWTLIAVVYLSIAGVVAFAVSALCALGRKPLIPSEGFELARVALFWPWYVLKVLTG